MAAVLGSSRENAEKKKGEKLAGRIVVLLTSNALRPQASQKEGEPGSATRGKEEEEGGKRGKNNRRASGSTHNSSLACTQTLGNPEHGTHS